MMEPPAPRSKREKIVIKILVLGSSNVGKTSIMTRYATGVFSGQVGHYTLLVGVERRARARRSKKFTSRLITDQTQR